MELAASVGVHHRAVGHFLSCIQDHCLEEKLPPLTILVVGASGMPGDGFIAWDVENLADGLNKVYGFNWGDYPNPFAFAITGEDMESIAKAIVAEPSTAAEYYCRVKVRGIAQKIFRVALLESYGNSCCISQLSFTEALEACHIVSWSESSDAEKLNPANGLLLNSFHHKLFDSECMTIDTDYRILYYDPKMDNGPYSEMDRKLTVDLIGKSISLPCRIDLWPSKEFIIRHNQGLDWL